MDNELVEQQLPLINKRPIAIKDFHGDDTVCVVEHKGRCANFAYDIDLAKNINEWLDNLPMITVADLAEVLKKYNATLNYLAEILEDEELIGIENIDQWVSIYNNELDHFSGIDTIDWLLFLRKESSEI